MFGQVCTGYALGRYRQMFARCIERYCVDRHARFIAVVFELQVTSYCIGNRVRYVRKPREMIVFAERARGRHAAGRFARFEDEDVKPGAGQVRRADKAVVTGADNDRVSHH
jgi:hypothetical protein